LSERTKPSVLFVCVKNGGKSQMAAAMMRQATGDTVDVYSAGTKPGAEINALSAASLLEVGLDISDEKPKAIDPDVLGRVDRIITLGRDAKVDPVPGAQLEKWETDEPSDRGIDGIERMRLVRDDIAIRVRALAAELYPSGGIIEE
jgi:arsenate-mycothiol transferase